MAPQWITISGEYSQITLRVSSRSVISICLRDTPHSSCLSFQASIILDAANPSAPVIIIFITAPASPLPEAYYLSSPHTGMYGRKTYETALVKRHDIPSY